MWLKIVNILLAHGLHMNVLGKGKMARKISDAVKRIVTKKKENTLTWKDKFMGKNGGLEERRDILE
jgi:hypothetical protein